MSWEFPTQARIVGTALALALLHLAGGGVRPVVGQAASDLVGPWLGEARHNDQVGQMAIEIDEDGEGGLTVSLSFPELDAWDIVAGRARLDGRQLIVGPWTIEIGEDDTITGMLPGFFVPVHEIPVVFRRVEALDRTPPKPMPTPTVEPVWVRDLGSPAWAGLRVDGDLVLVGDDSGRLHALDTATGEPRWEQTTGGAIRSRPTVVGGTLFVHSDDGDLYALEPGDGRLLWRTRIAKVTRIGSGEQGSRYNHFASSVARDGETVYVGGFDGSLVALDAASGAERWRFAAEDTIAGTPAVAGGRVVFGSFDGRVYALDAGSGEEVWRYETGAAVVSSPLVRDGLVLIGSRSYDLLALDAGTGELLWKVYYWYSWVESSASERDGVAYVGASDGQLLHAVDLATGNVVWQFDTRGSAWAQPAVTAEAVFIGTVGVADYWANHEAGFFAVDRRTGEPLWQFPQARPGDASTWGFAASPAVDGSRVFVADTGGRVFAFRQRPDR
jgi:outer membrane protein assembly factor BamB